MKRRELLSGNYLGLALLVCPLSIIKILSSLVVVATPLIPELRQKQTDLLNSRSP